MELKLAHTTRGASKLTACNSDVRLTKHIAEEGHTHDPFSDHELKLCRTQAPRKPIKLRFKQ